MATPSFNIIVGADATARMNTDVEPLRKELKDYQNCVQGNPRMVLAITEVSIVSGHMLEPEMCAPIDRNLLRQIMHDAVMMIVLGMKVNGKPNSWSCGFLGSRWFDMDAEAYGLDYIRCAFYSRKHYQKSDGAWKCDKPYMLQITAEKGK